MTCTRVRLVVFLLASLVGMEALRAQAPQAAAPDPWYSRQPRPRNIDGPKVFTNWFSIELPKATTVFSVVEKTRQWESGGLVTLEYEQLQAPLEPSLVAAASERELNEVKKRELGGKNYGVAVKIGALGPIVFIQYDRPGFTGGDNRVVQYSIPVGRMLYRLVCIAPASKIEEYRPIFAHVAASFTPLKAVR
jgi:hypothetical protein